MTLKGAMSVLKKDAEFCGMEFNKYLGTVGMHRSWFPQSVLKAFDVYAEHIRKERDMER